MMRLGNTDQKSSAETFYDFSTIKFTPRELLSGWVSFSLTNPDFRSLGTVVDRSNKPTATLSIVDRETRRTVFSYTFAPPFRDRRSAKESIRLKMSRLENLLPGRFYRFELKVEHGKGQFQLFSSQIDKVVQRPPRLVKSRAAAMLSSCQANSDALMALFVATDSTSWTRKTNWGNGGCPCDAVNPWEGITCSGDTITEIRLYTNNLDGDIPNEFCDLPGLTYLDLTNNDVTLPDSISRLGTLEYLDLELNLLPSIPITLGDLSSLKTLDLSDNGLTTLPSSFGNLSNLEDLNIHSNLLEEIPANFGSLTSLTTLNLSLNYLTSLPNSLGSLNSLGLLLLDNNTLKNLPDSFGNLSSLSVLLLNNNPDLTCYPSSTSSLCGTGITVSDGGTTPASFSAFCADTTLACCSSPTNLALGDSATQSSTYGNGSADLAVDSITNGSSPWSADLQHTNNETDPWWQVDLGHTATLDSIRIFNRSDCCYSRLSNVHIFASHVPFGDSASLAELVNDSSIFQVGYSSSALDPDSTIFETDASGRYLRIQLDKTDILHMSEVEVFGCEAPTDTYSPSEPLNLISTKADEDSVVLSWDLSSDVGSGVVGYYIYQDSVIADTVYSNSGSLHAFQIGNTYHFNVSAFDYAGNESVWSSTLEVFIEGDNCGNLALGKTAQQSSTYGNGTADIAVDGDTIGNNPWIPNLQHTNNEFQPWWEIDLGVFADIDSIKIFNREDCCQDRLSNFYIFISAQAFSPTDSLNTLLEDTTLFRIYTSTWDSVYTYPLDTTGQFVRIQMSDSSNNKILHMAEVRAYGCEIFIDSLAPSIPQNLITDSIGTDRVDLSWSPSTDPGSGVAGYYVYIDGNPVDTLYLPPGSIDSLQPGTTYNIQVAAYDSVGNVSALSSSLEVQTSNTNCGNLALGKPAEQSSDYGNSYAGLAVDGNTLGTTPWTVSPDLQHTSDEATPWWQVDLGSNSTIDSIVIYNRTNCCTEKLKDFYVLVSEQPFDSTASLTNLLADTTIFNTSFDSITGKALYNFPIYTTGQYVRVQIELPNPQTLHMAEVQVFGCETLAENEAPSVPQNLVVNDRGSNSITFSWDPSADAGSGIAGYYIYQDSVLIDSAGLQQVITISQLLAETTYGFNVAAFDSLGNVSSLSEYLQATTTVAGELSLMEQLNCDPNIMGSIEQVTPSPNKNYIHTTQYRQQGGVGIDEEDKWQNVTYFDGLGRPIQSVDAQASPKGIDVVTHMAYDSLGRQPIQYLPFTSEDMVGTNPGGFTSLSNPLSTITSFYQDLPSIGADTTNPNPIAITEFEPSPLNRPIEQGAPGEDWQPVAAAGQQGAGEHTVVTTYLTNSGAIPGFDPSSFSHSSSYYPANTLNITQVIDENGALTETATDKLGRTLYKSVQVSGTDISTPWDNANFATTYFVYDVFGNVRYVIQPEGWKTAKSSGLNDSLRTHFCFQYVYDGRQRVIGKVIPGADTVYLVYDKLDRVVAIQDGNLQANNQWLVTKYDYLGRP
ncbi:MAG: discoidin domain-containing protein, partial [Bacteroidota bacterium]